jgi:hypothetical protein
MNDYLMILGGSSDTQLNLVRRHLEALGTPLHFLDHDDAPPFHLAVDPRGQIALTIAGEAVPEPALVWCRLKISLMLGDWSAGGSEEYLRRSEWVGCLGALALHYESRSIFSTAARMRAEYKLQQLVEAAKFGFLVPPTDFFIGKQAATAVLARGAPTVAKVFQTVAIPKLDGNADEYRMMSVMDVSDEQVRDADPEEFAAAPSFFQERLRRGSELRVLAIGDHVHCYRHINSVAQRDRPDERYLLFGDVQGRPLHAMATRLVETPPFLATAIPALLRSLGLVYGAVDVIETDEGFYFLEVNPEGQWSAASHYNIEDLGRQFAELLTQELADRSAGLAPSRTSRTEVALGLLRG